MIPPGEGTEYYVIIAVFFSIVIIVTAIDLFCCIKEDTKEDLERIKPYYLRKTLKEKEDEAEAKAERDDFR